MAPLVIIFLIMTSVHCLGDFFMKRSSIEFTWANFLIASIFYVITIPGYLWLMRMAKLSTLASVGSALQLVVLVLLGVFVFNERLSVREMIGVFLAIAAIAMFYK